MSLDNHTQATFYQYRLLKKITFSKPLIMTYLLLPGIVLILELYYFKWISLFSIIFTLPIILYFQFVVSRSTLAIIHHSYRKKWRISFRLPWLGYMPDQHTNYRTFQRVELHTAWLVLLLIAIFIPWAPISFVISMMFWHLWILLPRWYAFLGLQHQPQGGMIKLSDEDISYYMP
ncbi:hypothetical protein J2Z69_003787 [Paenibacillus shirakamiensis]|uniref:Transposase n=1 Tax=Paenibacillus shirakamiensis TaxID=1265935 RepID=A0ABS4JLU6_9BACL|nr:hypothetical protein [Paenibacillus shirakamiensis]MBP2002678.1 hypothetical protein [Paenibacillus shirakamiensis]